MQVILYYFVGTTLLTSTGTPGSSSRPSYTTHFTTGTTTKRCEEMQAVDEQTSKQIKVTPIDVKENDKPQFQPTSKQGVSFPSNDRTPTITVTFGKPAEVQSVTIPRDKTPNANVQQFEVTFYSPNNQKINDKPILSSTSPANDDKKPARIPTSEIPTNELVSRIEITIIYTTDGESPSGVILDIKACTESTSGK